MMELWNSLGCRMCKQPLEHCIPVNKTNTRRKQGQVNMTIKYEGTFRQQLLQGAKAEELDPKPVAAKCGHIFHRGCIKKLTTELNSSCIECPICLKPIVLTQTWPIDFYHPETCLDSTKRPRTLQNKVYSMNDKNNTLQDELVEVRRLRIHKEAEFREVCEAIQTVKQSILLRRQELDEKNFQLFGTPTLDERYEENVRLEKEAILQRVKDLTNRNSELLASIEERAKTHYVNEEENVKEDSRMKSCFTPERTNDEEKKMRQAGNNMAIAPDSILRKPTHISRSNCVRESGMDLPDILHKVHSPIISPQIKSTTKTTTQNQYSHQSSNCEGDNLFHLLKVQEKVESGQEKASHLNFIPSADKESPLNSSIKLSRSRHSRSPYPIPMATVTQSMQELFEQEKLKYLENRSKEEELVATILHEQSSDETESECKYSTNISRAYFNLQNPHSPHRLNSTYKRPTSKKLSSKTIHSNSSHHEKIHHFPSSGQGDTDMEENDIKKHFKSKTKTSCHHHNGGGSPGSIGLKNFKFKSSKASVKGKKGNKSQPPGPHLHYKLAFI